MCVGWYIIWYKCYVNFVISVWWTFFGRKWVILFWWCVIFFINDEEINDYFFDGIRNIFFSFGIKWWFICVSCILYLKFVIVCRLWISIVVCWLWVKFVIKLLNLIIFMFFRCVVVCCVSVICFFRVNIGFLLGLVVIVRIMWLNICVVCVMILIWPLVMGLKVFG